MVNPNKVCITPLVIESSRLYGRAVEAVEFTNGQCVAMLEGYVTMVFQSRRDMEHVLGDSKEV